MEYKSKAGETRKNAQTLISRHNLRFWMDTSRSLNRTSTMGISRYDDLFFPMHKERLGHRPTVLRSSSSSSLCICNSDRECALAWSEGSWSVLRTWNTGNRRWKRTWRRERGDDLLPFSHRLFEKGKEAGKRAAPAGQLPAHRRLRLTVLVGLHMLLADRAC